MHHEVHKLGLVPRFGFIALSLAVLSYMVFGAFGVRDTKADKIIKRGLRIAGEKPGSGLEKAQFMLIP